MRIVLAIFAVCLLESPTEAQYRRFVNNGCCNSIPYVAPSCAPYVAPPVQTVNQTAIHINDYDFFNRYNGLVQRDIFVKDFILVPTFSVGLNGYGLGGAAPFTPAASVVQPQQPLPQAYGQQAYGQAGVQAGPSAVASAYDARFDRIEQALAKLTGEKFTPTPQPQGHTAAGTAGLDGIFVAKCGRCHEQAVAGSKGKKFVITIGNQISPNLTIDDLEKINDAIMVDTSTDGKTFKSSMPNDGVNPFTDQEAGMLGRWQLEYLKQRAPVRPQGVPQPAPQPPANQPPPPVPPQARSR
jgi:hypothetical protein